MKLRLKNITGAIRRTITRKGILKDAFTGAVLMGGAKLAFNGAARALDTTGIGAALAVGCVRVATEIHKDYKSAKQKKRCEKNTANETTSPAKSHLISSLFTRENNFKYAQSFAKGAVAGFAGAWALDIVTEAVSTLTDNVTSLPFFSSAPPDMETPPLSDSVRGHKPYTATDSMRLSPDSVTNSSIPPLLDAEPVAEPVNEGDMGPVEETDDAVTPADFDTMEKLEALKDSGRLSTEAQETVYWALEGKSWALNQAIDGMINERFGFEENRALAIALTEELVDSGDAEGRLKLAYMQYSGKFTAEGVAHDPQSALETVKELGRSWYGGEEVLTQVQSETAGADVTDGNINNGTDVADEAYALSCTAQENSFDVQSPFTTECISGTVPFVPGETIDLRVEFLNGKSNQIPVVIGSKATDMSAGQYLEGALTSILNQITPDTGRITTLGPEFPQPSLDIPTLPASLSR